MLSLAVSSRQENNSLHLALRQVGQLVERLVDGRKHVCGQRINQMQRAPTTGMRRRNGDNGRTLAPIDEAGWRRSRTMSVRVPFQAT